MASAQQRTIYEILGREPVHPFPARMAPGIALDALRCQARPLRVLDPMMGSGTVIAMARSEGHRAVGIDIDPLAVLIASVWTTAIRKETVREAARHVLRRAENFFDKLSPRDAFPCGADDETKAFIRYWFDTHARRQLNALSRAIESVKEEKIRDALWCAFSRLIITKQAGASLAMDLAHSRPHKVYDQAPSKPFDKYLGAVEKVIENCIDKSELNRGPSPTIRLGDARQTELAKESIDLVLTSPPYINAIDYLRCSKYSLVWMGYQIAALRSVRAQSVGAEIKGCSVEAAGVIRRFKLMHRLDARSIGILSRYIFDMAKSLAEASRVLVQNGHAIYVVGENTIRGTYIKNAKIISALAEPLGLSLVDRSTRSLPQSRRYLPPPKSDESGSGLEGRMRREVVLTFRKS